MARMNDLCEQLKISESFLYVADSAAYANVIEHSNKFKWLSRVPGSLKLAKQLLNTPPEKLEWLDKEKGYKGYETTISYGNVKQRWLLVASEQAYQKAAKTLDKQIQKVCSKLSINLHLSSIHLYQLLKISYISQKTLKAFTLALHRRTSSIMSSIRCNFS